MILIKDMEMPIMCPECRFNECGACIAVDAAYKKVICMRKKGERFPSWCPIIEVIPYGPDGTLYKER